MYYKPRQESPRDREYVYTKNQYISLLLLYLYNNSIIHFCIDAQKTSNFKCLFC